MQESRLQDMLKQVVMNGPTQPQSDQCLGIGTIMKLLDCPQEVPMSKRGHLLECAYCQRMLLIVRRDRGLIDAPLPEDLLNTYGSTEILETMRSRRTPELEVEAAMGADADEIKDFIQTERLGTLVLSQQSRDEGVVTVSKRVATGGLTRWWRRLTIAALVVVFGGTLVWGQARLSHEEKAHKHTRNGFEEARTSLSELKVGIETSLRLIDEGSPDDVRAELKRMLANVEEERSRLLQMHQPIFPGDKSRFVDDITIPDRTGVQPGQSFHKVWEIENVGSVPWKNRFLQRENPLEGPGRLKSPERVRIPDTAPDKRCRIGIDLVAPDEPGMSYAEFKMVDDTGRYLLPNQQPLFVLLQVAQ